MLIYGLDKHFDEHQDPAADDGEVTSVLESVMGVNYYGCVYLTFYCIPHFHSSRLIQVLILSTAVGMSRYNQWVGMASCFWF
jgi:hypothetical protein